MQKNKAVVKLRTSIIPKLNSEYRYYIHNLKKKKAFYDKIVGGSVSQYGRKFIVDLRTILL